MISQDRMQAALIKLEKRILEAARLEWQQYLNGIVVGGMVPGGRISGPLPSITFPSHNHTGDSGDGGKLTNSIVDTYQVYEEQAEDPDTPSVNTGLEYAKDSGGVSRPFWKDSTGDVIPLTGS